MPKSYLIVCDRPPYSSQAGTESLDLAAAAAAFDMPVQVLLRGDGVYAALTGQAPQALHQKSAARRLDALEIYGVQGVFADYGSLLTRGLSQADIISSIVAVDDQQVASLLANADLVVQF